jgi:hypothetical protein
MSWGVGFPICALKEIEDMEQTYFRASHIGSHYYEGMKDKNGNGAIDIEFDDWRKLPTLTPVSILSDDIERLPDILKEQIQENTDIYEKMLCYGLYSLDETNMEITVYDLAQEAEEKAKAVEKAVTDLEEKFRQEEVGISVDAVLEEVNRVNSVIADIGEALQNRSLYISSSYRFELKGNIKAEAARKRILKDTLFNSPVILLALKKTIDRIEAVQQNLTNLSERMSKIETELEK